MSDDPTSTKRERKLIAARTAEGRKAVKARGVHMGWSCKLNLHQCNEALARLAAGDSPRSCAHGVDPTTIDRLPAAD